MTQNHGRSTARFNHHHHGIILNWIFLLLLAFPSRFPQRAAAQAATLQPPPPPPFQSKGSVTPTMTIALTCVMTVGLLLACASVYLRQCAASRRARRFALAAAADGEVSGWRLDPEVINAFPTFIYSEVKGLKIGKGALECAVCLNEFEDHERLRLLLPHCSHVFHADCIDEWLSSHVTCPVCRANLDSNPGETPGNLLSHDSDSEPVHHDSILLPIQSPPDVMIGTTNSTPSRMGPPHPSMMPMPMPMPRNSTTSESVVKPGENCERFTLKLPEEVRSRLVSSSRISLRTRSCVAFPRARSWRKGYRSSSWGTGRGRDFFYYDRSDRWEFGATPSSFSRACSARLAKDVERGGGGGGEESTSRSTPRKLLKAVKSPLYRLFGGRECKEEAVNVGERSFDGLRLNGQV